MAKESFLEKHQDKINFLIAGVLLLIMVFVFSLVKIYFEHNSGEVIARVNGEEIYGYELQNRMDSYPQFEKASKEMALQQMIQERLLLQRMRDLGLTASQEEVAEARRQYVLSRGLDEESFDKVLNLQGMSRQRFEGMIRNKVLLEKLVREEIYDKVNVAREEARKYYEENLEKFEIPETYEITQATFPNGTPGAEEAFAEKPEDLCSSVSENCGTFNVTRFSGLPNNLMDAIEGLEEGEYSLVETEFGSHVVRLEKVHPRTVEPFSAVREEIRNNLEEKKKSEALRNYLSNLRKESVIENYLLDEIVKNVTSKTPSFRERVRCIANSSVLYGAKWDSQTQNQLKLFGNLSGKIEYVECTGRDFTQTRTCEQEGIAAYPTWVIDGTKYLGFQGVDTLAGLTGCD